MACELDNDDDNDDEDDVNLNDPASPANSAIDGAEGRGTSRSTNEPLKKRPSISRKRQADDEFNLIKSLSQSITEKHKRPKSVHQSNNMLVAFGNYIANALSELDSRTCHLAQNKINNIIFEAQAGLLVPVQAVQEMQPPMMPPQTQHHFVPIQPQHPVMATRMRTSSPQSSIYAEPNSCFRDESARLNTTSGW